jgi:hypothetical protein
VRSRLLFRVASLRCLAVAGFDELDIIAGYNDS